MIWTLLVRGFGWIEAAMIGYLVAINAIYLFLMVAGYFALRQHRNRLNRQDLELLLRSPLVPGVSVLVPAFHEEVTISDSVRSMLRLRHPNHEVIVVNDGSKDGTLARLIHDFRLYRSSRVAAGSLATAHVRGVYESRDPVRLLVIDKENGGKADALNAGINYARMPLVAAVDADSIIERDALMGVIQPFLLDPETVASGGIVRVANGCGVEHGQITAVRAPHTLLTRMQAIEYLRAFLGGRVAFGCFNALLVISGAFGVFRKDAVAAAGGFATGTVGEDMELVVRLHHLGVQGGRRGRIVFLPEPVCWTEVPESLRILRRQRNRWQRGALETVRLHRGLAFRRGSGVLGWFALPYFTLFEVFGPVVETAGTMITVAGLVAGLISPVTAAEFFLVSVLFGMALSLAAVLLEAMTVPKYPAPRDLGRLAFASMLESFGYRQLNGWWRLEGLIDAWRGRGGWGRMERRGFAR